MARARNIKHGFFLNEELAELEPLARLLFAGLWVIADKEGRLEDRPKKIKALLLPYDNCDVDRLLAHLHDTGFILRYTIGQARYIQVVNFQKHQNVHPNENPSVIPEPSRATPIEAEEVTNNRDNIKSDSEEIRTDNAFTSFTSFPSFPSSTSFPSNDPAAASADGPMELSAVKTTKPEKPKRQKKTGYSQEEIQECILAFADANNYNPKDIFSQKWTYGQAPIFLDGGYTLEDMRGCVAYMRETNGNWWSRKTMKIADVQAEMPTYKREEANGWKPGQRGNGYGQRNLQGYSQSDGSSDFAGVRRLKAMDEG